MTEQFANKAQTTLNGAITNVATSLVVTSAAAFPGSGTFRLIIGFEILIVTAVAGSTFTVTRGAEGTTAAAHSDLVPVTAILTAGAIAQLKTDAAAAAATDATTKANAAQAAAIAASDTAGAAASAITTAEAFATAAITAEESATKTLTNKTINGASNTLTVRAASDITGVLPTANQAAQTLSGDATGTTAAVVNTQARGLKSATTTVDVSAATAPVAGQQLTATSGTAAAWATSLHGIGVLANTGSGAINDIASTSGGVAVAEIKFTGASPVVGSIVAPAVDGQKLILLNETSDAGPVKLQDSGAALGTAANRIWAGWNTYLLIPYKTAVILSYDLTNARWVVISAPAPYGAGPGSVVLGPGAVAGQSYGVSIGNLCISNGAGNVAIGESAISGASSADVNNNCMGISATTAGNFANVYGSYCATAAGADGAFACGVNSTANRPGQFAHSSGCGPCQGGNGIDLYRQLAGVAGNLQDRTGAIFNFAALQAVTMTADITAVTYSNGLAKIAFERHVLLFAVRAGPANQKVLDVTTVGGDAPTSFASNGWSLVISCIAGTSELRFAFDPGADNVRVLAHLSWTEIGNL